MAKALFAFVDVHKWMVPAVTVTDSGIFHTPELNSNYLCSISLVLLGNTLQCEACEVSQ